MSDIKIQTTAPGQLEGGQQPLQGDAEQKSTCGFVGSQVFRGFPPAPEVQHGSAGPVSPAPNNRENATVGDMYVAAPVTVSVKPVDRKTLEGSTPGDFRAKAADAKMPNQPAPRQPVGQASLNSKLDAASKPISFNSENVGS